MTDNTPASHDWYQHKDGGVYRVWDISINVEDKSLWVVYSHMWPFSHQVYHRRLLEFTPDRFRKITFEEVAELMGADRLEAQLKVTDAARDRKALELREYRERQLADR